MTARRIPAEQLTAGTGYRYQPADRWRVAVLVHPPAGGAVQVLARAPEDPHGPLVLETFTVGQMIEVSR